MSSTREYIRNVDSAFYNDDIELVARLLSIDDDHVSRLSGGLVSLGEIDRQCRDLQTPLNSIVPLHLGVVRAHACSSKSERINEMFKAQLELVSTFSKHFRGEPDNCLLPVLFVLVKDIKNLGFAANARKTSDAKKDAIIEKVQDVMMSLFRVCTVDNKSSQEETKKWGMMCIANQLFRIYFHLNKLKLCDALIKAVDSLSFREDFPMGQLVTYKYFVGRKAMFDGNYALAANYLSFAFENCLPECWKNKRAILISLIPINISRGKLPKPAMFAKYKLNELEPLVDAIRNGDYKTYECLLEKHEDSFIKWGIYLLLEKLRNIVLRNLFKKVYLMAGTHLIPVSYFQTALEFVGYPDADNEHTHCILANLIYENKIKGYISYQHQKVVVSKEKAFPALSET